MYSAYGSIETRANSPKPSSSGFSSPSKCSPPSGLSGSSPFSFPSGSSGPAENSGSSGFSVGYGGVGSIIGVG